MVYGEVDSLINVHDPAGKVLSGLNTLNHDDANGVAFVMDEKIGRCAAQLGVLFEKVERKILI